MTPPQQLPLPQLTAQAAVAAQQEMQRHLALDRDYPPNPMMPWGCVVWLWECGSCGSVVGLGVLYVVWCCGCGIVMVMVKCGGVVGECCDTASATWDALVSLCYIRSFQSIEITTISSNMLFFLFLKINYQLNIHYWSFIYFIANWTLYETLHFYEFVKRCLEMCQFVCITLYFNVFISFMKSCFNMKIVRKEWNWIYYIGLMRMSRRLEELLKGNYFRITHHILISL